MATAKAETLTRVYAYHANDKFYRVTVTATPRELARDAIRKGLLDSKGKRAQRANGGAVIEAAEVTKAEAFRIQHSEVV